MRRTAHSWRPAPKSTLSAVPAGKQHPRREPLCKFLFGFRRPAGPGSRRRLETDPTYRQRLQELPTSSRRACPPSQTERPRVEANPPPPAHTQEGGVLGYGAEPRPVMGGEPKPNLSRLLVALRLSKFLSCRPQSKRNTTSSLPHQRYFRLYFRPLYIFVTNLNLKCMERAGTLSCSYLWM